MSLNIILYKVFSKIPDILLQQLSCQIPMRQELGPVPKMIQEEFKYQCKITIQEIRDFMVCCHINSEIPLSFTQKILRSPAFCSNHLKKKKNKPKNCHLNSRSRSKSILHKGLKSLGIFREGYWFLPNVLCHSHHFFEVQKVQYPIPLLMQFWQNVCNGANGSTIKKKSFRG